MTQELKLFMRVLIKIMSGSCIIGFGGLDRLLFLDVLQISDD
jgi:hypothetical protein